MGRGWVHGIREVAAAKKGKLFTKIAKEIVVAVKFGGSNPEGNAKLKLVLQDARKNSMPKDTIDRAMKRATGEGQEDNFEEIVYEGYGPHGVAMLVETLTDNKNRTVQDLRAIFVRGKGNLGEQGSVAWMFDKIGSIIAQKDKFQGDPVDAAIEAGAAEVEDLEENQWRFLTDVTDLLDVQSKLEAMGWNVLKAEISFKAKTPMPIEPAQEEDLQVLVEKLEDHDDVKKIHLAV
ncbi:MAG: YebC/PmpR family DNA-binding transcriptional regulator [Proteobacteria bacterium]|nr:YebC/PmpR family DNA-binding transcriptional regulator [Pseudomonadota bacterium]